MGLIWLLGGQHHDASNNDSDKSRKQKQTAKLKAPGHRYRNYEHPTEDEHRTAEQFSWRNSYALNVFIAIAAAITVVFAAGSFYETRRQANIAESGQRAWINPNISPQSVGLVWNGNSPSLVARVTETNEGNSPAIDAQVSPILVFRPMIETSVSIRDNTRRLCKGIFSVGNMLFMKDSISEISVNTLTEDPGEQRWIQNLKQGRVKTPPIPVPLKLIVCAAYKIVGGDGVHHTVRLYRIGRKGPNDSILPPFLGQSIPAGEAILVREYNGEYAD